MYVESKFGWKSIKYVVTAFYMQYSCNQESIFTVFYQVFFCKAFLFGARKTKSKNSYNVFLTILGKFEEQAQKYSGLR